MTQALGTVGIAAALMFLISGAQTLLRWRTLMASLLAHGVLRYERARFAARNLPRLEIMLGASVLAGFTAGDATAWPLRVAAWSSTVLYLLMTAYLLRVLVPGRAPAVCHCFGATEPLTWFSVFRTLIAAVGLMCLSALNANGDVPTVSILAAGAGECLVLITLPRLIFAAP
ncbi:MAG TPA: MauE/DoxX family redox-associated membrane protein [Nocardioides sp.]|uniref:MauE/DoxX family redox-associated membrane protein n=1 Tax=Nocardioides sp. TaxID=35761 RepID=UPI002E2FD50C|nr:MauE/DoxX family redox-associated membrane protein [Nocardioides sp.]HEX5088537.1 MauE/DoxX family redox-associated membrane protein [Nocardioides sp.]